MIKQLIIKIVYYTYLFFTAKVDFRYYWILSRAYPVPHFNDNPGQQGNHCYGNWLSVKNVMGRQFDPNCMIEHGLYFGRVVLEDECRYPQISTIYTYSLYRKEVLMEFFGKDFDKNIVVVGPYIQYANHMLSVQQRQKIKENWGRVLLVFPSHSSPEGELSFDYHSWLEEIEKRAKTFDTVIISLFWLDIYNGNYTHYLNKGWNLACCGNRFDPNFLSRQKDMISLADMTMSNDIGTHIGYCVSLGKPHYIYRQNVCMELSENERIDTDEQSRYRMQEYDTLYNSFSRFETEITDEQKQLIRYYWGDF